MMNTWTDVHILLPSPMWTVLVATPRSKEKVKFGKCLYNSTGERYWVTFSTQEKWWAQQYSLALGRWWALETDEYEREVTHWMAFPALPRTTDDIRE